MWVNEVQLSNSTLHVNKQELTCSVGLCAPWISPPPLYTFPASFSLLTRSSTVSTFIPACLCGGSSTLNTSNRDVRSTPKSAGFTLAIFFFLAFWKKRISLFHFPLSHLILYGNIKRFKICFESLKYSQNIFKIIFEDSCLQVTMILGRVAYLGVFSRRSAVRTAGVLILIVSSPPSISRTTLIPSFSSDTSEANVPWSIKKRQKISSDPAGKHARCSISPDSLWPALLIWAGSL